MKIFHSYVSLPEGTGIFPLECILDPNSFWPSILYITTNYITTIYHHCIPIILPLYHHYILFFFDWLHTINPLYHHWFIIYTSIFPLYFHYITTIYFFFSVGYIPLTHYITTDSLYIPVYSHYITITLWLFNIAMENPPIFKNGKPSN